MKLIETIEAWARQSPARPAALCNDRVVSYRTFARKIEFLRCTWAAHDLPAGGTAVVATRGLMDNWTTVLALRSMGMTTVSVLSLDVAQALDLRNVSCIAADPGKLLDSRVAPSAWPSATLIRLPESMYASLDNEDEPLPVAPAPAPAPATGGHIVYTSGTTGRYKKLMLDGEHENARIAQRTQRYGIGPDTVWYGGGLGLWTGAGYKTPPAVWMAGGCMVFEQRADWADRFFHQEKTDALLVPYQVASLLEAQRRIEPSPPPGRWQLTIMGGFLTRAMAHEVLDRLTDRVGISYSATELGAPVMQHEVDDLDEMHWLKASPGRVLEVVDEEGHLCQAGAEGQLRVRLEPLDCSAYLDDPQTTAKVFREGYFYPGDMAVQRADGRVRVLGRSADVINVRGTKKGAAQIEETIGERLKASAVCLFTGLGADGSTEMVVAVESKHHYDRELLTTAVRDLTEFEQVRIEVLPAFPRNNTGMHKVDRQELRRLVYREQG